MVYVRIPAPPSTDVPDLLNWADQEFNAIEKAQYEQTVVDLRQVSREPVRPREGMIIVADGTNWNPGSGEGPYIYQNGVWRLLLAGSGGRPILTAAQDFFVDRALGNDTTGDGSSALPWLTIPKAVAVAQSYDNAGFAITIKVRNGTYPEAISLLSFVGTGAMSIVGVSTTWPTSPGVIITGGITSTGPNARWNVSNVKLNAGPGVNNMFLQSMSEIRYHNIEWGASEINILTNFGAQAIGVEGQNDTLTGSCTVHWAARKNSLIHDNGRVLTISGGLSCVIFAQVLDNSTVICNANLLVGPRFNGAGSPGGGGDMTGRKFSIVGLGSTISTNGAGPAFLPGNAAGDAPAGTYT